MARRKRIPTRVRELEIEVEAMEQLATDAGAARQFGPAAKARAEAARLRAALARARAEAEAEAEPDALRRLARLRRAASEAGSWVAAAQLLRQEEDLRRTREAEALAASRVDDRSDEDLVSDLAEALRSLPDALRARVVRRAEAVDVGDGPDDGDGDGS